MEHLSTALIIATLAGVSVGTMTPALAVEHGKQGMHKIGYGTSDNLQVK